MIGNLNKHIERSFKRLSDDIYSINRIWQNENYDWPGDFEGRALLAFVCLYEFIGKKLPFAIAFNMFGSIFAEFLVF